MLRNIKIRTFFPIISGLFTLQLIAVSGLLLALFYYANEWTRLNQEHAHIISKADELRQSSDDLTRFARLYVITGHQQYLTNYHQVLDIRNGLAPRPQDYHNIYWDLSPAARAKYHPLGAPESLAARFEIPSLTAWERQQLQLSQQHSDHLVTLEKAVFAALTNHATPPPSMLFSADYRQAKHNIMLPLDRLLKSMENRYEQDQSHMQNMMNRILAAVGVVMILFLATALLMLVYVHKKLLLPINYLVHVIRKIKQGQPFSKHIFYKDEIGLLTRRLYAMKEQMDQSYQNLEMMSFQDALTGLHNRHYFYRAAAAACKTARRNKQTICLLMCDVDHFKSVNDTYGHLLGDEALRHIAALIAGSVRESDLCARFGGEEFIVLLQNTQVKNATQIAEKIRAKVAAHPYHAATHTLNLTISIGSAQVAADGNIDQAIDLADKAMYQAKNQGRNHVCEAAPAADDSSPTVVNRLREI